MLLALLGAGCREAAAQPPPTAESEQHRTETIFPIPPPGELDPRRVGLGQQLFQDRSLSGDGTVACATCHDLARGGADGLRFSRGVGGAELAVNTPTVFNAALSFRQFWDGRAASLEEQVEGPLLAPHEMASSWPQVLASVRSRPELRRRFDAAYSDGVTPANVRDALATFERSLLTPDSAFDRYLDGDRAALSPQAERGYRLFTDDGCSACHQGRAVGGNMFQKLGVMADYFADRGDETEADQGRFNVTHDEADRHVFKVPSLRNVALTAPYLHDGSQARLQDVIRVMARYQLGRELPDADVADLQEFLRSLTGRYQGRSL